MPTSPLEGCFTAALSTAIACAAAAAVLTKIVSRKSFHENRFRLVGSNSKLTLLIGLIKSSIGNEESSCEERQMLLKMPF